MRRAGVAFRLSAAIVTAAATHTQATDGAIRQTKAAVSAGGRLPPGRRRPLHDDLHHLSLLTWSGPSLITIDSDRATAVSSWWAAETQPGPALFATGTYVDELKRVEGRWKIARRRQTVDSTK